MIKIYLFFLLSVLFMVSNAQVDLDYYMPLGVTFDPDIPQPKDIIRHEVGEWHISHDRLVNYMYAVANASDRVVIKEIGETFEGRPQLNLVFTSPKNHQNLDNIKAEHVKLSDPVASQNLNISNMPAVAYLGYSIHGNESSGSNASMLVAYYLAAAQGEAIDKILDEKVIILDPSFNPDGLNRFSSYVNANKSHNRYDDPNNHELNEPWPGGRTNHYWFDMNRDWLFVQLPESRARIARFQEWKPNLLTDHHEMGSNSTFFFQPGIPSRNNPGTPKEVYRLTRELGKYHAKALDSIGSLYYTNESFDDYYYGKGSTYPDVNGAVGILFEQASSRGHLRETDHGVLTFPFTIKNQFNTSLSSIKGLNALRVDFLNHQRKFYSDVYAKAKSANEKVVAFASEDKSRNYHLAEILSRHEIPVYHAQTSATINGRVYPADEVFFVPMDNAKHALIKTMFDANFTFQDSLFYDVSTWTLPLSFHVDYQMLTTKGVQKSGRLFDRRVDKPKGMVSAKSDYAYLFSWADYYAPKVLNELLNEGVKVKVAHEKVNTPYGVFDKGSMLIPVELQEQNADAIYEKLQSLAKTSGVEFYGLSSGLSYETVSLGSPSFEMLTVPKIAMLVGDGIRAYDAGEVWHLFDQRFNIEMAMLPTDKLDRVSLDRYNTLIMVNGSYSGMSTGVGEKLKIWVQGGGTIVASQGALHYLNKIGLGKFKFVENKQKEPSKAHYEDIRKYSGAQQIGGAIFQTKLDLTNPLFYGYTSEYLPVFRNTEDFMEISTGQYANPMQYTENPLLSGYISDRNLDLLRNTSALGVSSFGQGKVIGFMDNLNFRAIWYGTNKVFMNAIFFGRDMNRRADR